MMIKEVLTTLLSTMFVGGGCRYYKASFMRVGLLVYYALAGGHKSMTAFSHATIPKSMTEEHLPVILSYK